jgi:hypothetical protein
MYELGHHDDGKTGHTEFRFVDKGRHRLAVDVEKGLIIDSSAYEPVKLEALKAA